MLRRWAARAGGTVTAWCLCATTARFSVNLQSAALDFQCNEEGIGSCKSTLQKQRVRVAAFRKSVFFHFIFVFTRTRAKHCHGPQPTPCPSARLGYNAVNVARAQEQGPHASRPLIAQCLSSQLAPGKHGQHLWGGGVEARQVERVWVAGVSDGEVVAHHADHHQLRLDAGGRAVLLQSHLGMHRTEPRLAVCVDNETVDGDAILQGVKHRQSAIRRSETHVRHTNGLRDRHVALHRDRGELSSEGDNTAGFFSGARDECHRS